jgi:hypothetical protein
VSPGCIDARAEREHRGRRQAITLLEELACDSGARPRLRRQRFATMATTGQRTGRMQHQRNGFSMEARSEVLEAHVAIGPDRAGLPEAWQLAAIAQRMKCIIDAASVALPELSVRFDPAQGRILLCGRLPVRSMTFAQVLVCLRRMERLALRLECYTDHLMRGGEIEALGAAGVARRAGAAGS